ncbi:hypothetical protein Tco_1180131, partial [Tanacetum coccineum]
ANKKMESDVGIAQTAKLDNVWIHGGLSDTVDHGVHVDPPGRGMLALDFSA